MEGWTAALDGFDDLENGIFGWWIVGREGDLACASAVGCLALEAKGLRLADGHDVPFGDCIPAVTLLAKEERCQLVSCDKLFGSKGSKSLTMASQTHLLARDLY